MEVHAEVCAAENSLLESVSFRLWVPEIKPRSSGLGASTFVPLNPLLYIYKYGCFRDKRPHLPGRLRAGQKLALKATCWTGAATGLVPRGPEIGDSGGRVSTHSPLHPPQLRASPHPQPPPSPTSPPARPSSVSSHPFPQPRTQPWKSELCPDWLELWTSSNPCLREGYQQHVQMIHLALTT